MTSGEVRVRRARSSRPVVFPVYAAIAVLTCAIEIVVLKLWHADLRIPLYYAYGGDAISQAVQAKMLLEGWVFSNPLLGAPFGAQFLDFPTPSFIHLLAEKVLVELTRQPIVALNLYYLASFPLCALSALYTLRRLGLRTLTAFSPAVLYAFLPGHFERNESHLFYATYFFVPPAILACLWVAQGAQLMTRTARFIQIRRDGWIALAAMAAIGSDNQYHAFFAGTLLALAALIVIVRSGHARAAAPAILLAAVLGASFAVNVIPTIIYQHAHGKNQAAFNRLPAEAEIYALTIAQLVLPVENHRLPALARKREIYDSAFPSLVNENSFATLGAIGSIGFLALLAALVIRLRRALPTHLETLALFNGFALLLATVGGFGSLFNYYVWPGLRAYNRISPFIAFFALSAVGFGLHAVLRRKRNRPQAVAYGLGALALVVAGVWDQTTPTFVPPYAENAAAFASDATFVRQIAAEVPHGSAIFELPYIPYPESPPVEHLDPARQGALYLHSRDLRWSGLGVKGRTAADWQSSVSALDPGDEVRALVFSGFAGIAVFRDAYADPDETIGPQLAAITHSPALVSSAGDLAFYSLEPLRARVAAIAPDLLNAAHQAAWKQLADVRLTYGAGFSVLEKDATSVWRWSDRASTIEIANGASTPVPMQFTARVATGVARASYLRIELDGKITRFGIPATGRTIELTATVGPGEHRLLLASDASQLVVPTDPRPLYFRLIDPRLDVGENRLPAAVQALFTYTVAQRVPAPAVSDVSGCYKPEAGPTGAWRWCAGEGVMSLVNPGPARSVELTFTAATPGSARSTLVIAGRGVMRRISVPSGGIPVRMQFRMPAGASALRFSTDARAYPAAGDRRRLILRLNDLRIRAMQ